MEEILSSPGMAAALWLIVAVQAVSLLVMALVIELFRRQRARYLGFLRVLGDETALGHPGRILLPAYALATVGVAVATVYLFAFQPHLL